MVQWSEQEGGREGKQRRDVRVQERSGGRRSLPSLHFPSRHTQKGVCAKWHAGEGEAAGRPACLPVKACPNLASDYHCHHL